MKMFPALKHYNLTDEFIALARTGCDNAALTAWAKTKPELADSFMPKSWKDIRIKLNCGAPRGGVRPSAGRPILHVGRLREGVRDRQRRDHRRELA